MAYPGSQRDPGLINVCTSRTLGSGVPYLTLKGSGGTLVTRLVDQMIYPPPPPPTTKEISRPVTRVLFIVIQRDSGQS